MTNIITFTDRRYKYHVNWVWLSITPRAQQTLKLMFIRNCAIERRRMKVTVPATVDVTLTQDVLEENANEKFEIYHQMELFHKSGN